MKILLLSDIHGYLDGIIHARNYCVKEHVHSVILMGDYSVGIKEASQNRVDATYSIEVLKENAKILAIPGNTDQISLVDVFKKEGVNLHDTVVEIDGVSFVGFGGSNPTPFRTPTEFTEEEIKQRIGAHLTRLKKEGKTKVVLIVHFPPKDTACDKLPNGLHVGSQSLRALIEEYQPAACFVGHIHEAGGTFDKIGGTIVHNVGKLDLGGASVFDTQTLIATPASIE
ncbi:Calcineurin-like phosphoesterase superfamily domain protein [uncultured archaeon]|nr:Calcineurin-like phosphoesterase superfamily domain protein [uncultured archaeon]